MLNVIKIYPRGFASNTYFLTADGVNCIAVDPSQPFVLDEAKRRGLCVRFVLLTHGHFDHIGGVPVLQNEGAQVGCLNVEKDFLYTEANRAVAREFYEELPRFKIDFTCKDGETLSLCGLKIKVIATPGHTPGGACFLCENTLFTGDTLFQGSVGRSDFPMASEAQLYASVKKLYAIEGDYIVYAGHGDDTTLDYERENNFYVQA